MKKLLRHGLFLATVLGPMTGCGLFKSKQVANVHTSQLPGKLLADSPSSTRAKPTEQDKQELQLAIARSMEKRGEIKQAKAIYNELAKHDHPPVEAMHRLAIVNEKEGNSEVANEYFEQAIAAQSDNPELISDFGYSCYLRGDLQRAEKLMRHAIALDPYLRRAHNTLGMLLARSGRESEAIASFRRGGCNATSAQLNLAFAQSVEGKLDAAKATYERIKQSDPSSDLAHQRLASVQRISERLTPSSQSVRLIEAQAEPSVGPAASKPSLPRTGELELVDHEEVLSDPAADWQHGIRDFWFVEDSR